MIVLKFGTKVFQYVFYLMLKKPIDYCGKFRAIQKIQISVPNFKYQKIQFCRFCTQIVGKNTRNLQQFQIYIELNFLFKNCGNRSSKTDF